MVPEQAAGRKSTAVQLAIAGEILKMISLMRFECNYGVANKEEIILSPSSSVMF